MVNKKKKKTEINNGNPLFMIDRLNAYKWIKFAQSLILIVMGIIYISICKIPNFDFFITVGFSVTLLLYSVLEIFGAIMLKKSILSTEIFVSLMIFSVSLMTLFIKELQQYYVLTWFFGILIVGYALILIVSGVLAFTVDANDKKYGTKAWKRITTAIFQLITSGILIALDVCLWIFGPLTSSATDENTIMLVPILIGVALIFMGGASMFYGFQANKTERILKKQADQTSFKEEEPEEDNKVENDSKDSDMVDVSKDEKKEDDIITVDVQDTESENSDIKMLENKGSKKKKKRK